MENGFTVEREKLYCVICQPHISSPFCCSFFSITIIDKVFSRSYVCIAYKVSFFPIHYFSLKKIELRNRSTSSLQDRRVSISMTVRFLCSDCCLNFSESFCSVLFEFEMRSSSFKFYTVIVLKIHAFIFLKL